MTWKEAKDATLQLMFAYSTRGQLDEYPANKDYVNAMPTHANFALIDLATTCRPLVRTMKITQYNPDNILKTRKGVQHSGSGIMEYMAHDARSVYFEVAGNVNISITDMATGVSLFRYTHSSQTEIAQSAIFPANVAEVRFVAESSTQYTLANLAFYREPYTPPEKVDGRWYSYDIKKMVNSTPNNLRFRMLANVDAIIHNGRDISRSCRTLHDGTVWIPSALLGTIAVTYYAFPARIQENTKDDFVLDADEDVAQIVPLYMASKLYLEDNITQAVLWNNEYEQQKQVLASLNDYYVKDQWVSETGWTKTWHY